MTMKISLLKRNSVVWAVPVAALMILVLVSGCGKEEPGAQNVSADQPAVTTVATEQETCPIMEGNPINKNIFVEYEGKKVYFCCKGCPEKFLANPEKYVAKLPQFKK